MQNLKFKKERLELFLGENKGSSSKVKKVDIGGAQDGRYESAGLHNRQRRKGKVRFGIDWLFQLMSATRDELFTHLSNQ